jgi:diguanylate cyclase (GGDEF)-like protein/PAS domain S-box-containing protein
MMNIAKLNKRILIFRIIIYNILLILILAATSFFIYGYKLNNEKNIVQKEQKDKFLSVKSLLESYVNQLKTDTIILSKIPSVTSFFKNKPTPADKQKIYRTLSLVIKEKKYYDKIRILDLNGNEVYSVINNDGNPTSTKQIQLENKSDRYYFEESKDLQASEVFISKFDYNITNDKIDSPMKPTLRLVTPIYLDNTKKGYLVVNFLVTSLAKNFTLFFQNSPFKFYLINPEGKFLFFNSSDKLLDEIYNSPYKYMVFKRIILDNENFFSYDDGIFYKQKISIESGVNTTSIIIAIEYPKSSFEILKAKEYDNIFNDTTTVFIIVAMLLSILIIVISRLNLSRFQFKIFGDLVQQTNDSVIITDAEGGIIFANNSFLKTFELTFKEALKVNVRNFNSDFHDTDFYSYMWRKINTAGYWEGEIVNASTTGEKLFTSLKVNSIDVKKSKQKYLLWTYKDLTESKYEKIENLKMQLYDTCTGLPNKTCIQKHLTKLIKSRNEFCVLSINITNLSQINNSHSFETGDILLLLFVEKLKKIFNEETFEGRINENRIIAIVPSIEMKNIDRKLKKILAISKQPFSIFSEKISLKLNIGVVFYPDEGINAEQILEASDNTGHNTEEGESSFFRYFSKKTRDIEKKKYEIIEQMNSAIENNEFSLFYQAKVNTNTNKITGAETLIRWQNSKLGNVSPAVFIPIAEETGYIDKITDWTIEGLCKQVHKWKHANIDTLPISINISPYEFEKEEFTEHFIDILNKYSLGHKDIEIEVTEDALVSGTKNITHKINKLKTRGFKILVDDFGTGNSSLGYLKSLNVDVLKIDREFIKNYPETDNGGLAKIITDIAATLKLEIIAEGVETEEQVSFLRSIGCHIVQGYYYCKPTKVEEFEKTLQKGSIQPDK